MTAAELLRELYSIQERIDAREEHLKRLRELATSSGGIRYDKERIVTSLPQEGGFENKVIEVAMLCDEIQADLDQLKAKYARGVAIVESVENVTERTILDLMYVQHKKIADIAEKMHYTESNIYYHKKKAMDVLETVLL